MGFRLFFAGKLGKLHRKTLDSSWRGCVRSSEIETLQTESAPTSLLYGYLKMNCTAFFLEDTKGAVVQVSTGFMGGMKFG